MFSVDDDRALVVVVTPKTLQAVPIRDVLSCADERRWAVAIVEKSCEGEFQRRYSKLPWDRVWILDLSIPEEIERVLAEVEVFITKPYSPNTMRIIDVSRNASTTAPSVDPDRLGWGDASRKPTRAKVDTKWHSVGADQLSSHWIRQKVPEWHHRLRASF